MTVPVFLLILLGMLEFGFAFSHHLTMEYSTREGARTGAALANGSDAGRLRDVDDHVMAAVQRVLTGAGSQIALEPDRRDPHLQGRRRRPAKRAPVNAGSSGPARRSRAPNCSSRRGRPAGAPAAARTSPSGSNDRVDSIGVSLAYDYDFVTPAGHVDGRRRHRARCT